MPKRLARHIVELFVLSMSVGCLAHCTRVQEPRLEIPNEAWVPIFFEGTGAASKPINELTREAKLPSLRTIRMRGDDLEVRVWVGFGLQGVDGLVLRRSSNQWSAIHLHGMADRPPFPSSQQKLDAPKSGWEAAWRKLVEAGILTLPDASELRCRTYIKDGTSYIVETNMNSTYRTYLYDNPKYARCNEARQMIRIGEMIGDEFSLDNFMIKD
ncbi:MAG TPA: hypothetical protein VJV03_04950 [Pyrinomonadaceae bacterium]|nr:hypothetical protein [Pyrinomonadaceae bacterium]